MRTQHWVRRAGVVLCLAMAACSPPQAAGPCASDGSCGAPLICVFSACRTPCSADAPCAPGTTCVRDAEGRSACTAAAEETCSATTPCPAGLLCVGTHCRAACGAGMPECAPPTTCEPRDGAQVCVVPERDASMDGDAQRPEDAGRDAAADSAMDAGQDASTAFCSSMGCTTAADCFLGACDEETVRRIGTDAIPVTGLPGGAPSLEVPSTTGGSCVTQPRARVYTPASCNWFVNAPTSECGACARCVLEDDPEGAGVTAVCHDRCDPASPGSCRAGYACNPVSRTCVDACASDTQCRIDRIDSDGNGYAGAGDTLAFDPASEAVCTPEGLCDQRGTIPFEAGAACERHAECGPHGLCVSPLLFGDPNHSTEASDLSAGGFAGGYCTRTGCREPGRECGDAAICTMGLELFASTVELCLDACEMGAEPVADRIGTGGHGAGCRPGYRCRLPSDQPRPPGGEPATGGCIFGNYTDVVEPNVGAPCRSVSECWSPFGSAGCSTLGFASESASPACFLDNCLAPGLPADFCGPGAACADFGTASFCLRECDDASECAPGWGCLDFGRGGSRLCLSNCITSSDCRAGEGCFRSDPLSTGVCVAGGTCGSALDIATNGTVQPDGSIRLIGGLGAEEHAGCGGRLPGTALVYVPPADGVVFADAGGAMADGTVLLRARADCDGISSDLACGLTSAAPSQVALRVQGGRPYYLLVDRAESTATTFDLALRFVPVLRPGERCDPAASACPDRHACTATPAGDFICAPRDEGCGLGVLVEAPVTLTPGPDFALTEGTLGPRALLAPTGSCFGIDSDIRVFPFVSPVDGELTLVGFGTPYLTVSVRTDCPVASSERSCSVYDASVAQAVRASALETPAYPPSRVEVTLQAGVPVFVILEGTGDFALFANLLPSRALGAACDPTRNADVCRTGSLCDAATSRCVARDEGCGVGVPVVDLTSRVPVGDDVRFTYSGPTPALSLFVCTAAPIPADTWHHIRIPGSAGSLWEYELRASMGFASVIRTATTCGGPLRACERLSTGSYGRPIAGGSDLYFSVMAGPGAGATYEVGVRLTRVSVDRCGAPTDPPCAESLACHAGTCTPTMCGDGIREGGEVCDGGPFCAPDCSGLLTVGAGAASCTGAPPTVTLTASRFGPAFGLTTSTLGDAPSISTCAGPAPARLFTLDVPVASHLRGRATSFAGVTVVSVRRTCSDDASQIACAAAGTTDFVDLAALAPGRYVLAVQFPAAGPGGTMGAVGLVLVPD